MTEHTTRILRTALKTPERVTAEGVDLDLPIEAKVLEDFLYREDMMHILRLATLGQLAASFSHEANNSLSLIEGSLTLARGELPSDHPVLANLAAIDRAVRNIDDMSKRMLAFSRTRSCCQRVCDMKEIVEEAVELMRPHFRCSSLKVTVDIPSALPPVRVERWQIMQAMANLLRNACDAVARSPRREVSISVIAEAEEIRIRVSDTGPGIPAQDLPKIFKPFFTTKGEWGTGLGLYLTRRFVEEHQGTIDVQSGAEGTIFTISLPLQQGTGASYSP